MVETLALLRYNSGMKAQVERTRSTPFAKWDILVAAIVLAVVLAVLLVVLLPKDAPTTATVYVDGKVVSTMQLDDEFNPVRVYNGVQVRVSDGKVQTVYEGRVATLYKSNDKIVYPTLGVVVEVR